MLLDGRVRALTDNVVGQWLQLRNLDSMRPSQVLFADLDDGLREDRSVLDLLVADYTFVNDRLAKHYGMAEVQGSHFRRLALNDENRGGLLGQGSILTITSHRYAPSSRLDSRAPRPASPSSQS